MKVTNADFGKRVRVHSVMKRRMRRITELEYFWQSVKVAPIDDAVFIGTRKVSNGTYGEEGYKADNFFTVGLVVTEPTKSPIKVSLHDLELMP